MGNPIILFLVFNLCSCSSDDNEPSENQEYLEQLSGEYKITAAYFDEQIDLNGNGHQSTDFYEQIEYAHMSTPLEYYKLTFYVFKTYKHVNFTIPFSDFDIVTQSYTNQIMTLQAGREISIDSNKETFSLVPSEHEENFILDNYKAKILDLTWEDREAVLRLETELFTSEGVWETVILTMEYEWEHDNI